MMFFALIIGVWISIKRAKKAGIAPDTVMDLTVWLLISGLVGARLTYVLFHLDEFSGHWLDTISPIQSDGTIGIAGLVVLGSILGAFPAAVIFLRRRKIPFWKMIDILAPGLVIGMGIGRIGCFLNGCCFGLPTDLPWGVVFPSTCFAGHVSGGQPIHPTQIYDMLGDFLIAGILIRRTPKMKFDGELFMLFMVIYGVFRFFIETIRYYGEDALVLFHMGSVAFTFSMLISLAMAVTGLWFIIRGKELTGGGNVKR